MKNKYPSPPELITLRRRAEARLKKRRSELAVPEPQREARTLIHELHVHQIELELQNEELAAVRAELEAAYANLYDFAPVSYFTLSRGGLIRKLNLTAASLLQAKRARLTGQRLTHYLTEETRPAFQNFLKKVFAGQVKETCAVALRPKAGGSARWLQIEATAGASGEDCRAVAMDISERKRAEEELREREEHLRLFAEHAPAAVAMLDSQMRYVAASQRWQEDYGLTGQELLGRSHYEVFPDIPQRWKDIHRRCLAGAIERAEEDCFERVDGSRQWLRWEVRPWHMGAGNIGGIIIFSEDITAHKQAEEALRASERRERERGEELATILEAIPTPVIIVHDPEARHMTGNRAADELLQQPRGAEASLSAPAPVRPRHFKALKNGRELRLDELPAQRATRGEHVRDFEFSLAFDDGTVRELLGYGTPLLDAKGRPRGAVHVLIDITARKRAEAGLRASEERFRVAQELSLDAFTILRAVRDDNGRIVDFCWVYVNPEAGRVLRHAPQELVGQRLLQFLPGNKTNSDLFERYVCVVETGQPHDYELPYESEGIRGWFRNMAVKLQDGIAVYFADITERKRTEESLRQSEERLRLVLQASSMGTFEVDLRTGEGRWNDTEFELLGLKIGDAPPNPETFFRYVHPDDLGLVRAQWEEALKVGKMDGEFRIVRADGQIRWVAGRGEFVFEGEGKSPQVRSQARHFLGVNFDITARKQAEEQVTQTLRESRRNASEIEAVLAAINDAVLVYDADMNVVRVNPGFLPVYGFDPRGLNVRDIIARTRCRTLDGRSLPLVNQPTPRARRGETVTNQQFRITRLDGQERVLETSAMPLRVGDRIVGTVTVWHDFTERKQIEEVQAFLAQTGSAAPGEDFFHVLARYLAQSLGMDFICIDRLEGDGLTARTVAVWCDGKFENNVTYALKDSPSGKVVGQQVCCFPASVGQLFPRNQVLQDLRAESYAGVTLRNHAGKPIGLIGVIGRQPLANRSQTEATLKLVAGRAGAELERQDAEATLRASENRYRTLFATMQEGFYLARTIFDDKDQPSDFMYLDVNPAFEQIMGRPRDQIIGRRATELIPDIKPGWLEVFSQVEKTGVPGRYDSFSEVFQRHFEALAFRPAPGQFAVLVTDVTERKRVEAELHRFNRTLRALNDSYQSMLRATTEAEFLEGTCRIMVEVCGHAMVWIGFAEEDEPKTVRPVAQAGFEEGYLDTLKVTWADTARGRGPTGTAIRTGQPCECKNMQTDPAFAPWRAEALKRGYASSLVLPLLEGRKAFGAVTIYSRLPDAFAPEEVKLLSKLAGDLAYGITALRLRQAHAQAEEALRASEKRYRSLFENMLDGFAYCQMIYEDDQPCDFVYLEVNSTFEHLTGLKNVVGKKVSAVIPNLQKSDPKILEIYGRVARTGQPERHEILLESMGIWFSIAVYSPQRGFFAAVFDNITARKQAEAALHANRELLNSVIEGTSDCIYVKDLEGRYLLMNAAAARLTGRSVTEVIGQDDAFLFPPAEAEVMKMNDQMVFAARLNLTYEESITSANGEHHMYYTTKGMLRDRHGSPTGLFGISRDITELKRTQDKLTWLASFPELNPLPIAEVDLASGTVHYINPTARRLFPDLETRGLDHPWLAGIELLAQPLTGDPVEVTQREVALNGAHFEQSISWVAETRRIRVYSLDITKRKRALEALRESEERYRSLFNSMTEGFALHEIICDQAGQPCDYRFLDINPSFERMTGQKRAAVVGRTVREVLPEEDNKWIKSYGEVALTGQAIHFENYSPALKKYFEVYAYRPVPGQFAVIFMDITERKTIEQALQDSEEQAWDRLMEIETVYNTAPVGLCVLDRALKFRRINGRMAEITGRPVHYHLDRTFREVLPDLANEAEPLLLQVMQTGQPVLDLELTGETSSLPGITRTWKESFYPLRNFAGEITGINIVILEITEEKRAQDRVRRLNEDLERRVGERTTQLTKTMSALRMENAERKRAQERLEVYQQDLRRLANQVVVAEEMERRRLARDLHDGPCQVLALVRMQLGSLRRALIEPKSADTLVEAGRHLEQAIQTMRSLMLELSPPVLHELGLVAAIRWLAEDLHHRYGLKVHVVAEDQPKLRDDQLNILLFRCVRELLINVAKHARVTESHMTIRREPDGLRLVIEDDGVGFDPRQKSEGVEATHAGGFGLFSIGEQLTPLGGRMEVRSSPGQGTTVSLWLPQAEDPHSPAPATKPEADGRGATDAEKES